MNALAASASSRLLLGAALLLCSSPLALAQSGGTAPAAQEQSSGGLGDIVVTARRRAESLQETPVAVTAFGAETIDRKFATDIRALSGEIPNVVITNVPGFNAASIGIRGQQTGDIILTFEPAVAVVVDDFVIAHVQTQLFDMFDIERIEVLRGPQGTLFGKNTVGGVVNVITKRPTQEFEAETRFSYGSFETFDAKGAINLPIADTLALRVSVAYQNSAGFYRNTKGDGRKLGGTDFISGRAKLLWTPTEDTDVLLSYELLRDRGDSVPSVNETPPGFLFDAFGFPGIGTTGGSPFDTGVTLCEGDANHPTCPGTLSGHRIDVDGIYARAEHNWDGIGAFTLVGGYRRVYSSLPSDYTGEVANLFVATRDDSRKQYSAELRYTTDFSERFKATFGGIYWGQTLDANATSFLGFLRFLGDPTATTDPNQSTADQKVDSYSVFGEAEYKISDPLAVFVGARYTSEDKTFSVRPQVRRSTIATGFWPLYSEEASFSRATFKAGYRYEIADGINNYFTYSQGYKSGGFNEQAMSATSALPFKEETADSFELGFKTETADNRVRLNVAGFYVKYDDLQRDAVVPFTDPLTGLPGQETRTTNAGAAEVYGIEVEFSAVPVDGLRIGAALGWQKAKYNEFRTDINGDGINDDASFLKLRGVPEVTMSFNANYEFAPTAAGVFSVSADINYSSEYETSTLNADFTQGEARAVVNASIRWVDPSDRFQATIYTRNLFNEIYRVSGNSVAGLWNFTNYAPPRSIGIEVGAKF